MTVLRDGATRDAAARVFDRNLVVTAGAGTGKTSLLVERALNLLLTGRVPLSGLVALTFSRKAAAEMKERLAAALNAVHDAVDPARRTPPRPDTEASRSLDAVRAAGLGDAAIHARARALLDGLDGASIGTIHSFAADLLRRHPFEAALSPDFVPDEGEGRTLLADEIWPRFLRDELGTAGPRRDAWARILAAFPFEEVEELAHALLADPRALDLVRERGYEDAGLRAGDRQRAAALLARTEADAPLVPEGNMRNQMETQMRLMRALAAGDPAAFQAAAEDVEPPKFWETWDGWSERKLRNAALKEAILGRNRETQAFLRRFRGLDTRDPSGLFDVLRVFAERFAEEAARRGLVPMDELLLRARALLRDHPVVRADEARRARHLLVDEFQDTDPIQYEILFYLVAREPVDPAVDPYALALDEGRLFIVGDPKQSIYRFRGADIAAYRRAADRVAAPPDGPLDLTVNFRSVPEVIEPVNRLFAPWMRPDPDDDTAAEIGYRPIDPHRAAAGEPRVELWSVLPGTDDGAGARRDAEAAAVATWIAEWLAGSHGAGGPDPERPRRARDVAILFRSLAEVPRMARALREAGIDVVVDGGKSFAERPEFTEALALLRCLANPGDPVAFLAVLRSTLGGVDDGAIASFARDGGRFTWRQDAEPLDATHPDIARVVRLLARLAREGDELPPDRRIHELLAEGDLPLLTVAWFDGAQRIANLRKLAARAADLALTRGLGLEGIADAIEEEYAGAMAVRAEGESPLADEAVEAVRILSIHKAKGLEFPVVFIPDLNRSGRPPEDGCRVVVLGSGAERRLAVRTRAGRNFAMIAFDAEDRLHLAAEEKRLLYVAMTRAKERLVLVNSGARRFSPWVTAIREHWGYAIDRDHDADPFAGNDDLAGGTVRHRTVRPSAPARAEGSRPAPGLPDLVRMLDAARKRAAAGARAPLRTPSADHRAEAIETRLDEETARSGTLARLVGTAVHRALERWDFLDREALSRALETAVGAEVSDAALRDEVLREAEAVLGGFLTSALPGELAGAEAVWREVPVLYRDEAGFTVHGYADLVYRAGGRVRVADYKTDVVHGDPAEAAARYAHQLADYAGCVQRAMDLAEPPAAEVLFVRTGQRVELPPSS